MHKHQNIINFFEEVKLFKQKQLKQKKSGLNDYNLLTTVLKPHDEVRLHSRVIASLLDIEGLHYQEDLFLTKFLDLISHKDFKYDTKHSSIQIEYKNIDLYLTDGIKHIIIENKVYASDQKDQIKRYIEIIKEENPDIEYKDILVVYLSINRNKPSNYSLSSLLTIQDNYIVDEKNTPVSLYTNLHYNNHILSWIKSCKIEVQNINCLKESLSQYLTVVEKISKKYKSKVGNMKDIILANKENLNIASEIYKVYEKIQKDIVKEFYTIELIKYFQDIFDSNKKYENYKIEIYEELLNEKRSYPIRITHKEKDWKIVFQFGFEVKNLNKSYYGVSSFNKSFPVDEFINKKFPELNNIEKSTKMSILWDHSPRYHSYDTKTLSDFKYNTETVLEEYFNVFEKSLKKLEEYNITLEQLNQEFIK